MAQDKITPVILSGGTGSRLWPLSRALYPKQLLALTSEKTMLQETVLRVADKARFDPALLIANDEHRFIIAEQLREQNLDAEAILLEPEGRNTAPAVALAAFHIAKSDTDRLMLVMPSDHVIADTDAFYTALEIARKAAQGGALCTFGIQPDRPETGYGYIKSGDLFDGIDGCFAVDKFVEKPDAETAARYLKSGDYYWNSGIFLFSATRYIEELQRFEPDMATACEKAIEGSVKDLDFERPDASAFRQSPANSIDYAIMEKTGQAAVIPVDMAWNDVGAWSALWDLGEKDSAGNVINGDVLIHNAKNSLFKTNGPVIAAVGVENLIVVATKDAVLIADKNKSQDVKAIVDQLKASGREEHSVHTVVYRPWGSYETTDLGHRFQTKRLVVKPGAKLSLQAHHHRAEHWIVVQGTARVTCNDDVFDLSENESTYLPIGARHRLENPGKIPLHIIEVQSGAYLGEDDIIRFEDTYGRVKD